MQTQLRRLAGITLAYLLLPLGAALGAPAPAWLDGDPGAIWRRPPGFYQEADQWYAILHTRPGVTGVRLSADFTDGDTRAVELTPTPDGKFWWFKGSAARFARSPRAGDCYRFVLTLSDGTTTRSQDPAARRVESSNLAACSLVTVSTDYGWGDVAWRRPGWDYYQIYQLHPLRFSNRNAALTPLQRVTEELNGNGRDDHLARLGATAVQLLPVNEFPGDLSWGYNPSFFYAVESSYGTPDQLKALVDTAHRQGRAVILDVVVNHGGSGDNIL
jgi:1,4-alpha-glucan branching enzyme